MAMPLCIEPPRVWTKIQALPTVRVKVGERWRQLAAVGVGVAGTERTHLFLSLRVRRTVDARRMFNPCRCVPYPAARICYFVDSIR